MEAQNTEMIGQIIGGRYRLTKLLGEGGMGAVYAAEHINITKTVAVKLLHPEISSNEEAVTRFRQEAQSASSIGHPNIIGIDDFFKIEDGRLCLIMEFLKGESLADRMLVPGGLTPDQAIDIVLQVCEGLEAAHEKGIIHRDMKPENVFLANIRGKDVVKILDFGIAKVTGNEDNNLTKTGTVFGTPHYMSPEQALGHKVDARADVYSVGVMLFEIFTGQVPFQAESFMGVLSQHITKPTPAPSSFTPGRPVPPMMDDIILTAMAKEVDKRFSTMNALKGALLAFRDAMHGPQAPKVVTGKISSADVAARVGATPANPLGASPSGASLASPGGPPTGADNATPPAIAPAMASTPEASVSGAPPSGSSTGPAPQKSGTIPKTMMATGQQAAPANAMASSSSVPVVGSPPSTSTPVPIVPSPTATTPHRNPKKGKTGLIIGLVVALLVIGGGAAAAVVFWDDIMGNATDSGGAVATTGSSEGTGATPGNGTGQAIATNTSADIGSGGGDRDPGSPDGGAVATQDPKDSKKHPTHTDNTKHPGTGHTKHPGHKPIRVASADPNKPGDHTPPIHHDPIKATPKPDPVKPNPKPDPVKPNPKPHPVKPIPPKHHDPIKPPPPKPKGCVVTLSTTPSRASIFPAHGGFRRLGKTPKKFTLGPGETKRVKIAKSGRRSVTVTLSCDRVKHHVTLRKGFNPGIGGGNITIPGANL